jgi:uncharacterized membrane protein YhaH (DUF805 family)
MGLSKLFRGRINRINFFLGFMLSLIPGYLMILLFAVNDTLGWVGMVIYFTYLASLGLRRLHDTGQSGWWLLLGIPPLTQFMVIYLILAGGQPNANKYGEPRKSEGLLHALFNQDFIEPNKTII